MSEPNELQIERVGKGCSVAFSDKQQAADLHHWALLKKGATAVILRGSRCASEAGLLAEFAGALQFPYYFTNDLDSLGDCIRDLAWIPGLMIHIIVDCAGSLLRDDQSAKHILGDTLGEMLMDGADGFMYDQGGRRPIELILIDRPDQAVELRAYAKYVARVG